MSSVIENMRNAEWLESNIQAQEQEVKDYTEFLKIEYEKNCKYKLLLKNIEECIEDGSGLESELQIKIKNIILGEQSSQLRLGDNPANSEVILGVPLDRDELTFAESNRLLHCLTTKLAKKYSRAPMGGLVNSEFNNSKIVAPMKLAYEDEVLLDYQSKLANEQECYIKKHLEFFELLEELKNIRLKTVPEVTAQKLKESLLRSKINYLKAELARHKCRVDVFMESRDSFQAFTEIIKDIQEQQSELSFEIKKLRDLRTKYAEVSCREYEDILSSYLQYKNSIERKKLMYKLYG